MLEGISPQYVKAVVELGNVPFNLGNGFSWKLPHQKK